MAQAVVITGGSAGIGKTAAERIVSLGYEVVNLDLLDLEQPGVSTYRVDLLDTETVETVLQDVLETHEVVGLVNNVGYARTATLLDTDAALLSKTFALNLTAAATCARVLVPAMIERGYGRIVNVSSRSALGRELRTAYAASKGGLISMTRVWALELARYGITSNCVAPGPVATDLFDQMNPDGSDRREKMLADIPVRRVGTPKDIAHAIGFFLSPESGYVNGQTLYVCGGLSVGVAPV